MKNPDRLTAARLRTPAQAQALREEGWLAADLHVHSSCSYDVPGTRELHPEALYAKAQALGLDWITFTDHDTMDAYDLIGWERPGLVTGVELTIKDMRRVGHTLHVNVYELNQKQFLDMKAIAEKSADLELLIAYLQSQNLPYLYNHPFWFMPGESPNYTAVPEIMRLFPAVEYNMHRVRTKNVLAMACADRLGLGMLAATDTHIGHLGTARTLAKGRTFREFFQAVVAGEALLVPEDLTARTMTREAAGWINVIFAEAQDKGADQGFTEIPAVDWLMNRLHRSTSRSARRVARTVKASLHAVVGSGVPGFLYTAAESAGGRLMGRQLNLAPES